MVWEVRPGLDLPPNVTARLRNRNTETPKGNLRGGRPVTNVCCMYDLNGSGSPARPEPAPKRPTSEPKHREALGTIIYVKIHQLYLVSWAHAPNRRRFGVLECL